MLALHLLQTCFVYINTLIMQHILGRASAGHVPRVDDAAD
jgi:TnpA family transposase